MGPPCDEPDFSFFFFFAIPPTDENLFGMCYVICGPLWQVVSCRSNLLVHAKSIRKSVPSQEYHLNFTHVQLWRMCNHLKSNEVEDNTISRLRWSLCRQSSCYRGWSGDYEELYVCFSLEVSWTDSMKNEQFRWTEHARCFGAVAREARLRWFAI